MEAAFLIAHMRAERQLVTLRHPEKDITVPETILRACSPVLDGILTDASPPDDGGNKVLTIDNVKLLILEIFVDMITANSYTPTNMSSWLAECTANGLRSACLATLAWLLMPLIHKYDCKGLFKQVQEAVHDSLRNLDSQRKYVEVMTAKPVCLFGAIGQSIATILTYDTEDTSQLMTASTMNCLAAHLSADYEDDDYAEVCRAKLDELPPAVVADILVHVLTKAPLVGEGGTELQGAKRVKRA